MADILGTILSPVTSLIGSILNFGSQKSTNKINEKINERNLDYNKAMTEAQWVRDDNAHQREVADLQAAGLSPLASTNGANVTGALSAPSPIAMQAPQFDLNSALQLGLQNKQIEETKRHNMALEGNEQTNLDLKQQEINNLVDKLDLQNKELNQTIKYQTDLIEMQQKQISEAKRHNMATEDLQKASYITEKMIEDINKKSDNRAVKGVKVYIGDKAKEKYEANWTIFQSSYKSFITTMQAQSTSSSKSQSTSSSESQSTSTSANVSAGVSVPFEGGVNGSLGGSYGQSTSSSESQSTGESESKDISNIENAKYNKFWSEQMIPLFFANQSDVDESYLRSIYSDVQFIYE